MRTLLIVTWLAGCVACGESEGGDAPRGADGDGGSPGVVSADAGTAPPVGPPTAPTTTTSPPDPPLAEPDGGGVTPPPIPIGPTTTQSFQQGESGYAGTKSVGISTYGGLGSVGAYNANGMTFADGDNDWCTGVDIPQGTYSEVWLLRFEDLGLPANAQVVSAKLSVHAYSSATAPNVFLAGTYLAQPWYGDTPISCAGCSSPVGWRYRNGAGEPWAALGAGQSGADYVAGKSFRLPETGALPTDESGAPLEYIAALDPAVVQGWLSGNNFGVRIVTGVSGVHVGYVQPQRGGGRPISMRPKLTITYAIP